MINVEVLFPELCNLFGDTGNIRYLRRCLPEANFTATRLGGGLPFTGDLIYMGPMTEKGQERALAELWPHSGRAKEALEAGRHFLFTGNALELMGKYIEDGQRQIPCLGLFNYHAVRDMKQRHNSLCLGRFDPGEGEKPIDIVGFKSQFSRCEGDFTATFLDVLRGVGLFGDSRGEGVKVGNFIGTYLLGPILPLNPDFTRYLMRKLGSFDEPSFLEQAQAAYRARLDEFWTVKGASSH